MKISFNLNYHTEWGEAIYLCGDLLQLGSGDPREAIEMKLTAPDTWEAELNFEGDPGDFNYFFIVKAPEKAWRFEWGKPHRFVGNPDIKEVKVFDSWQDMPADKPYYSSAFVNGMLKRLHRDTPEKSYPDTIQFRIYAPMIEPDEVLAISGEGDYLGNWEPDKAIALNDALYPEWVINLPLSEFNAPFEYKFLIQKKSTKEVVGWETINNRICGLIDEKPSTQIVVDGLRFANPRNNWKGAGTAIPVFSIRTEEDFGVGDFLDIKKMVDWCVMTGQKMLQVLPINDTTKTGTWVDSYPYSANSTFALHPMYARLEAVGELKDENRMEHYRKIAKELNMLPEVDYETVNKAKVEYLREIYAQNGEADLSSEDYKRFFEHNQSWLVPYSVWRALSDKYGTPDNEKWKEYSSYDDEKVRQFIAENEDELKFHYFVQYHLDKQLREVRDYAHNNGVVLKGDIPIGIGRFSVDAWQKPYLFNMN
ncbi:MAG: 4-alpha-glucanotransferase [Muribaculaceae bacterium]|nr:4-alpha-glucanotransferase [Muribaculaceae bacterium]